MLEPSTKDIMNNNSLHLDFEKITDLITGQIADETEEKEISSHLQICPDCFVLKTRAEEIIGIMHSDSLEEVPEKFVRRAIGLLGKKRKPTIRKRSAGVLRKITAVLQNENFGLTPAYGLRSGQPDDVRRLWLAAEDAEIDLRIKSVGDHWNVEGQVFGDLTGGRAFLSSGEDDRETVIEDQCQFSFQNVPPGTYRLLLSFENTEIEIPEIRIGL